VKNDQGEVILPGYAQAKKFPTTKRSKRLYTVPLKNRTSIPWTHKTGLLLEMCTSNSDEVIMNQVCILYVLQEEESFPRKNRGRKVS